MRFLKHEIELWKRARSYKKTTLQRRLILFFAMVVTSVILSFTLLLILFGITGSGRQTVYRYLESEMLHISEAAEKDLGNLSVVGIHLAEQISKESNRIAEELGVPLETLLLQRDATLLSAQMSALIAVAEHNPCGGVFLALDAPSSEGKLPGCFIKKTQPVSSASLSAKTYCLRGSAEIARKHGVELLAQWQMDYDAEELSFFADVLRTARENPELPLSRLYYWSGRIRLNGNSETGILLSLPLRDESGSVYGICGIEVSDRMFKQLYSPGESAYQSVFAIAAPIEGDLLDAKRALVAGNSYLTGIQMPSDFYETREEKGFIFFAGEQDAYGGIVEALNLYPTGSAYSSEQWILAVLMPEKLLQHAIRGNSATLFAIVALLLMASLVACVFISRHYLRPIQQGISSLREKTYETERMDFGVAELDDLFAELAQGIREYREEIKQLRMEQKDAHAEIEKAQIEMENAQAEAEKAQIEMENAQAEVEQAQVRIKRLVDKKKQEIDSDEFALFLSNLKTLTLTERRVFDFYLEGKTPKEILELLQIKENTLKYHNRNIYGKLGVSSRKQLLQFATLMEQQ